MSLPPIAPHSPLIACNLLPTDFVTCDAPLNLKGNLTARQELGYGCPSYGGQKYHEVLFTSVSCTALPDIECHGNRTFMRDGLAGIDRFCLGHAGTAVGKLLTLGGAGLWWILDIIFLITGNLMPEDGSNWIPYV